MVNLNYSCPKSPTSYCHNSSILKQEIKMKKIVLSTMVLLMMSGVAIAEENCSDKYVESQIRMYEGKR